MGRLRITGVELNPHLTAAEAIPLMAADFYSITATRVPYAFSIHETLSCVAPRYPWRVSAHAHDKSPIHCLRRTTESRNGLVPSVTNRNKLKAATHQIGGSRHGQYARHWSASHAEFRGYSSTTLRAFLVVAERLARRAPELGSKPWVWRTDTGARLDSSDSLRHASLLHSSGDIRLSAGGSSDVRGILRDVTALFTGPVGKL